MPFLAGGPGSDPPLCGKRSPNRFLTFLSVFLNTAAKAVFSVREGVVEASVAVSGS